MKNLMEKIKLDEEEMFQESMQNAYLLITDKLSLMNYLIIMDVVYHIIQKKR